MGLDQYIENEHGNEIAYLRKHSDLQGYMQNVWEQQGNTGDFNCEHIDLTKEICEDVIAKSQACLRKLDELYEEADDSDCFRSDSDYPEDGLTKASGFFWGKSCRYKYQDGIEAMQVAIKLIENGETVKYHSWY